MKSIQMVDLAAQYDQLKTDIDAAMNEVIVRSQFIQGEAVRQFEQNLAEKLDVPFVWGCGNGTDALQMAFMALELNPGDEIIVPSFNYIAAAEAAALMGLKPVFVDVDEHTFCIDPISARNAITTNTKAIVAVHLFGQCAPMEELLDLAKAHQLFVIEDTAQAIGAQYTFSDGRIRYAGTMGDVGTLSFFPSKNLGCYGDGGAVLTRSEPLAERLKMIRNHGQKVKYTHEIIGINSRLDTLQAAILDVKLKHLDSFTVARQALAKNYSEAFSKIAGLIPPSISAQSTHVFHQYTLRCTHGNRQALADFLKSKGIPTMIYYPIALHLQPVFKAEHGELNLPVSLRLCDEVISLPMHTEMTDEQRAYIIGAVCEFFS
jgi:UDP-2-acetamido-2-deoxy-ribo-hexuluronate aminotransferase